MLLRVRSGDHVLDVGVPLVGDDGLSVVILCLLDRSDDGLDVDVLAGTDHLVADLIITLEELDREEALLALRDVRSDLLLDLEDRIHDFFREAVYDLGGTGLCLMNRELGRLLDARAVQRGDLHCLTAEVLLDLVEADLVAVLLYDIHHVHGHHHRNPELLQLCGEVEVTLEVRTIHDVQDRIRLRVDEVVSRDNLLQCVWRK